MDYMQEWSWWKWNDQGVVVRRDMEMTEVVGRTQ